VTNKAYKDGGLFSQMILSNQMPRHSAQPTFAKNSSIYSLDQTLLFRVIVFMITRTHNWWTMAGDGSGGCYLRPEALLYARSIHKG
jgi:hypothetical protein